MAIEEKFNLISTIVSQETFALEPVSQEKLWLGNYVYWGFSILFGQYKGKQVALACDGDGVLSVVEADMACSAHESIKVNADKAGTRTLIGAQGANKQIWIYGGVLTGSAEGTAKFIDGTPTDKSGEFHVAANGGFNLPISQRDNQPWFKCASNKAFQVTLSADTDLDGVLNYRVVDA